MTKDPLNRKARPLAELHETAAEIERLDDLRLRRDELIRELYVAGVPAPALAGAARVSETWVKSLVAESDTTGRRQVRGYSRWVDEYPDIGRRLRRLRAASRLTRREVAEKCGVSEGLYADWERNGMVPWPDARRLAPLLHTTWLYILFGHPAEHDA